MQKGTNLERAAAILWINIRKLPSETRFLYLAYLGGILLYITRWSRPEALGDQFWHRIQTSSLLGTLLFGLAAFALSFRRARRGRGETIELDPEDVIAFILGSILLI